MQGPYTVREPVATSAVRRARASSLRAAPPPERQPAQWRVRTCHAKVGCGLEAAAGTSLQGLATKERGVSPVQCPFTVPETVATSATWRARTTSSRAAPPPERQPAQWRVRTCHAKAGCALQAAADTSHHGLATKQRDFRRYGLLYSVKADHNQRGTARTRGKLACCAASEETGSVVERAHVPRKSCPQLARLTPRSGSEGERRSAGTVPFYGA